MHTSVLIVDNKAFFFSLFFFSNCSRHGSKNAVIGGPVFCGPVKTFFGVKKLLFMSGAIRLGCPTNASAVAYWHGRRPDGVCLFGRSEVVMVERIAARKAGVKMHASYVCVQDGGSL